MSWERTSRTGLLAYLMAGLGTATAMTLRMYDDRHGWLLEKLTVSLRHEAVRAADASLADRFLRRIELEGNRSGEPRRRLLDIAEECPISRPSDELPKL